MDDEVAGLPIRQLLTGALAVLVLFATAMFLLGEFLIAGVTFLTITFVIYLRETMG